MNAEDKGVWIKGVQRSIENAESQLNGNLPQELRHRCEQLLRTYYMGSGSNGGRNPRSIAAACEYAARLLENEKKTQDEISNEYGVGKQTIREAYQEILEPRLRGESVDLDELDCCECGHYGLYVAFSHPDVSISGAKQTRGYLNYTNLICPECGTVQSGEQNVWEYEH